MQTKAFVRMIKAGRIKPVLPMIAAKARETWAKLPHSEQSVRSVRDLIQEGVNFTVTSAAYSFNPNRDAKFTTFLYKALDNFYIDIIREVYAEKRLAPHGLLSLDSSYVNADYGRRLNLYMKVKLTRASRDNENKIVNRIDAHRGFVRAYSKASPRLRRYMIRWLLQPTPGRVKPGIEFNAARREFRQVVRPLLNTEHCDTIQQDFLCRFQIAEEVVRKFHTKKKESRSGFLNTEEFALAPIISQRTTLELLPTIG